MRKPIRTSHPIYGLLPIEVEGFDVQAELARSRSELVAAEVNLVTARANVHYQEGTLLGALKIQSEDQP